MIELERKVRLKNPLGLHLRMCTKFVEKARAFHCEISLGYGNETANGKDVLSLMGLGAQRDAILTLRAAGTDAEAAVGILLELLSTELEKDPFRS
jgi:phosphotransferase system HPr (HPr) family protein